MFGFEQNEAMNFLIADDDNPRGFGFQDDGSNHEGNGGLDPLTAAAEAVLRSVDGSQGSNTPVERPRPFIDLASPSLAEPKARRSSMAILRDKAIRQSNAFGGKRFAASRGGRRLFAGDENDPEDGTPPDGTQANQAAPQAANVRPPPPPQIVVNGETIPISTAPLSTTFVAPRRWVRAERSTLDEEGFETFYKSATGWVLQKGNKLSAMTVSKDDDKLLYSIKNLQSQLKMLQKHCYKHDILEVFTIVVPDDVKNSPQVGSQVFDLFRDYPNLHPAQVANSNAWYNNWVDEASIRQNLALTYEMLQKNVDSDLWSKALEDYDDYMPIQQGGPLMLFLILKRIMDVSETSVKGMIDRVKVLKITDLPGENVEDAVSLIKSSHKILKQCSSDVRNHVPDDFPELVLKVFQSSSQPAFNKVFADEESIARRQADKYGGVADYPSVSTLCTLAVNTYKRMTGPGDEYEWCKPETGTAYNAGSTSAPARNTEGRGNGSTSERRCFNCGKVGCRPGICATPLDSERIKRNAEAYKAKQASSSSGRSSTPSGRSRSRKSDPRKDDQGRPLMRDKKGALVVDQRKYQAQRAQALLAGDKAASALKTITEADPSQVPASFLAGARDIATILNDAKAALQK